jgi:hypothetical protein
MNLKSGARQLGGECRRRAGDAKNCSRSQPLKPVISLDERVVGDVLKVEACLEVHRLAPVDGQLGGADRERAGGEDLACEFGGAVERGLAFVGDAVDQTCAMGEEGQ